MVFFPVFNAVLSVFLLILLGACLRKWNLLREEALPSLMSMLINVLYPCLIFDKMGRTNILEHLGAMWLAPIVGFASLVIGLGIATLFTLLPKKLTGMETPELRHTFEVGASTCNYGYLPIPILLLLCPGNDEIMTLLFLFMIGMELALWICAVPCLAGGLQKGWWKKMLTVPLFTVLIAIAMNLLGGYAYIPAVIATTITWIGQAYLAMPLIVVGALVFQELQAVRHQPSQAGLKRSLFWLLVFRCVLFPVLMIVAALFLSSQPMLQQIVIIEGAMPTAMLLVMFSKLYGGSSSLATWGVVVTNLLSPVTAVLWISVGMWLVKVLG